ncbi:hypothetical protein [Sporanaerobacter acetigenes]|uniref:hypothetical protein n=1 Tax=Sporanaerobacter acetigenes TaxID=165813 RepID=UPI000934EEC2|nr:hypothetical protein [Sporanaerobacter acetigenes]
MLGTLHSYGIEFDQGRRLFRSILGIFSNLNSFLNLNSLLQNSMPSLALVLTRVESLGNAFSASANLLLC